MKIQQQLIFISVLACTFSTFSLSNDKLETINARAQEFIEQAQLNTADLVIWCREGASCGITLLSHPKVNLGIITTTTQLKQLIPKSVIFGDALFVIIKNNPEIPPDKSFEDFIYSTSDMITSRNSKLLALLVFPPGEFEKFLKCRLTKQCDQLNHSD